MKSFILIFIIALSCQSIFAQEQINYSNDKGSCTEWDTLVQKYPNDEEVQILHALRIGLLLYGMLFFYEIFSIFYFFKNSADSSL